jgi:bacterioferritin
MPESKSAENEKTVTRNELAKLLNEDLSREYQAIIAYVVYSQVLKGAAYMSIADQLEIPAGQELKARADHFPPNRLPRQNAHSHA